MNVAMTSWKTPMVVLAAGVLAAATFAFVQREVPVPPSLQLLSAPSQAQQPGEDSATPNEIQDFPQLD